MKKVVHFLMGGLMMLVLPTSYTVAQKIDEERMKRDIEIAENILSTLIKQQFDKRSFFPLEVRGNYLPGYGVTFTVPGEFLGPMAWSIGSNDAVMIAPSVDGVYTYSWSDGEMLTENIEGIEEELAETEKELEEREKELKSTSKERSHRDREEAERDMERAKREMVRARGRVNTVRLKNTDSLRQVANKKLIEAAKMFLADYGDMVSQLGANEKIVVTNRSNEHRYMYWGQNAPKRSLITAEVSKADVAAFRQGKSTRDQLVAKIKVTNTESVNERDNDLELLVSIFNRLYQEDLSKTYFAQGNTYYEKLSDYGAIVYMQVYSSNQLRDGLFSMPTIDMDEIGQEKRDAKVKELYPQFEKDLRENIVEYGRTVRTLKDNETLTFNVKLTRCKGCGIPATLEASVKASVLKDYSAGKIDKNAALAKIELKKGENQ